MWRYEKLEPGRFREFVQFDFDAVGVEHPAADAEVCCIMCDALEAVGLGRGEYKVKVNNRKILSGVLEAGGIANVESNHKQTLAVLRAIDKLDRLGEPAVIDLLGPGRDESGVKVEGAGLTDAQTAVILRYLRVASADRRAVVTELQDIVGGSPVGAEGVNELRLIDEYLDALGYDGQQVAFDPSVVRGLEYYTGPVFEGVVTRPVADADGNTKQFGSVFGGGRYDYLIERFTGVKVPATGASIGVDRLLQVLKLIREPRPVATSQVLVVVVEPAHMSWYLRTAQSLRAAGVKAEVYLGEGGLGKQVKYADKIGIPYALIAGGNEFARGVVQLKDLVAGREASKNVTSNEEWRKGQPSQREVPADAVVAELKRLLAGA